MADYQVMPPLGEDEYAALKADIAEHGILIPVELDEAGNVLDGHHRRQIAGEMGIDCPTITRTGMSEDEKRDHALRLNLARRHLSTAQKRELVMAELEHDPDRSNRAIGRLLGVDHKTVGSARQVLALSKTFGGGEIPHSDDDDDEVEVVSWSGRRLSSVKKTVKRIDRMADDLDELAYNVRERIKEGKDDPRDPDVISEVADALREAMYLLECADES